MQMIKKIGDVPCSISTRKSNTARIVSEVKEMQAGEYIQIECTCREASAIRQSLYRHCPSVKCRVNAKDHPMCECIIHLREEKKEQ